MRTYDLPTLLGMATSIGEGGDAAKILNDSPLPLTKRDMQAGGSTAPAGLIAAFRPSNATHQSPDTVAEPP